MVNLKNKLLKPKMCEEHTDFMKIAVLKERHPYETRVAATPETVKKMIQMGLAVTVEAGAGEQAAFPDQAYQDAGAQLATSTAAAQAEADVVLTIRPLELADPSTKAKSKAGAKTDNLFKDFKKDALLIGMLAPHAHPEHLAAYQTHGITALSLELIPRITRAQSMDVLSSQANLGGYRAVIDAAAEYGRVFPMMMTAAGTVAPAKVLILGAGVAGLQAIATAKRLGAVVSAFDVRAAVKEQVESLGAKFIEVEGADAGETKAGYAKEMDDAYKQRQADKIAGAVAQSDIVITTALIPGKPAPRLVTQEMVKAMKPGSVLVDMAVESGGNVEGSVVEAVIHQDGVKIIGYANLPGRLATEASSLYARNIFNLLKLLWNEETKTIRLDFEDEIIQKSVLTHGGQIVHEQFAAKQ
jgi:NAD/NADP transhydrogenase alpha subunit